MRYLVCQTCTMEYVTFTQQTGINVISDFRNPNQDYYQLGIL